MIQWASTRPAVVWAFGIAIILAGGIAFGKLPLATRTSIELPQLTVTAQWQGASAELIETYITSPIEAAIQGVRGVTKTTSTSGERGSNISVELEPDTDVQLTRLAIHERLELLRGTFPAGVAAPQVSNYVPEELEEEPLLRYSLSGPYTPGTLTRLAREQIAPRLTAVEGVSSVQPFGSAELGVSVSYDVQRLRQLEIPPALIATALANARVVRALGDQQVGAQTISVVLRDQPHVYQDLEQLPIRAPNGRVFLLGELASVRPEEDTRGFFSRLNGVPAVGLEITRLPGSDVIHTARRVRDAMQELHSLLPIGVRIKLESDESVELGKQLRDLVLRGAIAFAAVFLILLLAMRHLTSAVLVMGSAAVAIAGTALGLYLLKIPANLLTLAGLGMGIGILVQNGVVVVERLRHTENSATARAEAGRRITPAVLGATLTTAVVLLPFLYLQGNARAAFVPFAAAFAMALFWSVLSSVVMIPAVGVRSVAPVGTWKRLHRLYERVLHPMVRFRWITMLLTAGALGFIGWKFAKQVPRSSFGNFFGQRSTLNVSVSFPRGSDPQSLDRSIAEFERIAVGQPGVERVDARGGGSQARLQVLFTKDGALTALPLAMQEEMTQRAVLIGGASINVTGQGPAFFNGGGATSVAFRIKILGYSFAGVEQLAKDLRQRLEAIPRVRNVNINAASFFGSDRAVSVVLVPDRAALARAGITSDDLARTLSREIRGAVGGQRIEFDGQEITVTLKAAGARERSLEELRSVIVPTPSRAPVRVSDLARVDEREGLGTINRDDQQYVRIVAYDFRGPAKLANRTHTAFMKSLTAPAGYTISDQQFTWREDESAKGLWLVFGAGVVLVLLSVAIVFNSSWASLMVFLSLPLCLGGVAAIFWLTKTAFSREAAVGVILVVGHAVNQAILLIDAALHKRSVRPLTRADILEAASDRSGMIMLVTLATMGSLVPLAVGNDTDSLFGSIALALAGGMVAGTLGALFVVPAYLRGFQRAGSRQ